MKTYIVLSATVLLLTACHILTKPASENTTSSTDAFYEDFASVDSIIAANNRIWTGTLDTLLTQDETGELFFILRDFCSGIACAEVIIYFKVEDDPLPWKPGFSERIKQNSLKKSDFARELTGDSRQVAVLNAEGAILKYYLLDEIRENFKTRQ